MVFCLLLSGPSKDDKGSSKSNASVIGGAVGGAVGGSLVLLVLAVIFFLVYHHKKSKGGVKDGLARKAHAKGNVVMPESVPLPPPSDASFVLQLSAPELSHISPSNSKRAGLPKIV